MERRRKKRVPKHDTRRPRSTSTTTRSTTEVKGQERKSRRRREVELLRRVVERSIDTTTDLPGMAMEGRLALTDHQLRHSESTIRFREIYNIVL